MARKRKWVARSKAAKKGKFAVENTSATDTVWDVEVRTTTKNGVGVLYLKKGQHEKRKEIEESAVSVATSGRARAAASVARTKIKEKLIEEDEADADSETFSDESDIDDVFERVDPDVVKKGLDSLHDLTMTKVQAVCKEAPRGTRNVDVFNPSHVSNLPRDQQIRNSWISVEALEKIRKLEVHSDKYGKTTPKPDVLLPAPVQDEESPVMAQTQPQHVEPVLSPVTIPCEATIIFAPVQDKDEEIPSPTYILPPDKEEEIPSPTFILPPDKEEEIPSPTFILPPDKEEEIPSPTFILPQDRDQFYYFV